MLRKTKKGVFFVIPTNTLNNSFCSQKLKLQVPICNIIRYIRQCIK